MKQKFKCQTDKDLYNLKRRENYQKDPEKSKLASKNFRKRNKDKIAVYNKIYKKENSLILKEKKLVYEKLRIQNDPFFKMKQAIRCSIKSSFKRSGNKKFTKTKLTLGCSFASFKIYIEDQFESWMTWENYGKYDGTLNYGWDLDHIIPISSQKDEYEVLELNHFSNFQPLCSKINRDIKKNNI